MSIDIALIIIIVAVLILISIISNQINYRLDTLESRLIRLEKDIKYIQHLLNDKDIDTNDKDIRVVIYSNDKEIYEWRY